MHARAEGTNSSDGRALSEAAEGAFAEIPDALAARRTHFAHPVATLWLAQDA